MDVGKLPGAAVPSARTESPGAAGQSAGPPGKPASVAESADIRPLDVPRALQVLIAEVRAALVESLLEATQPQGRAAALPAPPDLHAASPASPAALTAALLDLAQADAKNAPGTGGTETLPPALLAALGSPLPETPQQATVLLVDLLLRSAPAAEAEPEPVTPQGVTAWSAAVARLDASLLSGFDRTQAAVSVWREVPATVNAALLQTREAVLAVLEDPSQNAWWLRPEWASLAPRIERYRRRRRRNARRLRDPDYDPRFRDDDADER
jgi:hypothetical protein